MKNRNFKQKKTPANARNFLTSFPFSSSSSHLTFFPRSSISNLFLQNIHLTYLTAVHLIHPSILYQKQHTRQQQQYLLVAKGNLAVATKKILKSNVAKKIYETYFKIKWKKPMMMSNIVLLPLLCSASFCNFCKMLTNVRSFLSILAK